MRKRITSLLLAAVLLFALLPGATSPAAKAASGTLAEQSVSFDASFAGSDAICGSQITGCDYQDEEWEVLRLVNKERYQAGLAPLTMFGMLQDACDIRASELTVSVSHTRPNGTDCFTVLEEVGIDVYSLVGENIAAGQKTPQQVMADWMNSLGHKGNILHTGFSHLGVGYEKKSGTFYTHHWAQLFYGNIFCNYTDMFLQLPGDMTFEIGTTIEDMNLSALLICAFCGSCYLPVLSEYCTGFDPNRAGTQTVTVNVLGCTATFQVVLNSGNPSDPSDPVDPVNPFVDVEDGRFYYEPVLWAVEKDITSGMDATHFKPESSCTRGQVVTFLWRAKGCPEPKSGTSPFVDVNPKKFYYKAVLWAYENGVTAGIDATHFKPEDTVTRGQFVTFLWRAEGKPTASGNNPFTDVGQGRFYTKAVLWAAQNGITSGMTPTTFAPESTCTRGQVVTFLYRAFAK